MLIDTYACGYLDGVKRTTLSGTYTPTTTGLYTLEIYNYRNLAPTTCVYNYMDEITVAPVNPDLSIPEGNISVSSGRLIKVTLNAGAAHAGENYFLVASWGMHPGTDVNGVHVPLNIDNLLLFSKRNANTTMFQNSVGTLNTSGMAIVWFSTLGPVDPIYLGKHAYFAYVLTAGPATLPVTYASTPVMISFIP